jgi:predicted ATPase
MVVLDKLYVENFRNIKRADIELRDFNVIVGPNNSGKSNVLQIISYLKFIITGAQNEVKNYFEESSNYHNLIPLTDSDAERDGETIFKLVFSSTDTNQVFGYELRLGWQIRKKEKYAYDLSINYEWLNYKDKSKPGPSSTIFERKFTDVTYGQELQRTKILEKIPSNSSVLRFLEFITIDNLGYTDAINNLYTILNVNTYYFSNIQLLKHKSEKTNIDKAGRIISIDLKEEILKLDSDKLEILKSILNDILKIEDIRIVNYPMFNKDETKKQEIFQFIFFTHFGSFKIYDTLSDGSILLIALITKILGSDNHIFFIEEPENSLHPGALVKLINFLRSYGSENQFIIATHSLVVLNVINPDNTIVACVDEKGKSDFQNITNIKDLKKKFKESFLDFSDYIFYEMDKKKSSKELN